MLFEWSVWMVGEMLIFAYETFVKFKMNTLQKMRCD
jgi:hypothetical protein